MPLERASTRLWHKARIYLECVLRAAGTSSGEIQPLCRWFEAVAAYLCAARRNHLQLLGLPEMATNINSNRTISLAATLPRLSGNEMVRGCRRSTSRQPRSEACPGAPYFYVLESTVAHRRHSADGRAASALNFLFLVSSHRFHPNAGELPWTPGSRSPAWRRGRGFGCPALYSSARRERLNARTTPKIRLRSNDKLR